MLKRLFRDREIPYGHVDLLAGEENHHCLEAIFKAFGRALRMAVAIDPILADELPSTKGVLE